LPADLGSASDVLRNAGGRIDGQLLPIVVVRFVRRK
jgi:hypothetical protein